MSTNLSKDGDDPRGEGFGTPGPDPAPSGVPDGDDTNARVVTVSNESGDRTERVPFVEPSGLRERGATVDYYVKAAGFTPGNSTAFSLNGEPVNARGRVNQPGSTIVLAARINNG